MPPPPSFTGDATRPIDEAWWLSLMSQALFEFRGTELKPNDLNLHAEPLFPLSLSCPPSKEEAYIAQALKGDISTTRNEDPTPSSPI